MEMNFGAPRRKEVSSNKEKYENIAVLTVSAFKGKGTARALTLNNKAIEELGINFDNDAHISFSFDAMKETVTIANTSGLTGVSEVRLAKTSKMASDKAYFDAIKKHFAINAEDEVEILLTKNTFEFNGHPTMNLSLLTATVKLENVVDDAVAENAPVATETLEEQAVAPLVEVDSSSTDEVAEETLNVESFEVEEETLISTEEEGEVYDGFAEDGFTV